MKKVILILLLATIFIPLVNAEEFSKDGDSCSKLGKYKIEVAESPYILNGKELKTYQITYENAGFTLLVTADKSSEETKYLTISDALSVQYVSYGIYFGVERIDQNYVASNLKTSDSDLNRYEYFHQKVLTSWEVSELEKIKLIAAYYPALLKNIDNHIAAK